MNVSTLDKKHQLALQRLNELGSHALLDFFESELMVTKRQLVFESDMVQIHRLQGKARVYNDLLKAVKELKTIDIK